DVARPGAAAEPRRENHWWSWPSGEGLRRVERPGRVVVARSEVRPVHHQRDGSLLYLPYCGSAPPGSLCRLRRDVRVASTQKWVAEPCPRPIPEFRRCPARV